MDSNSVFGDAPLEAKIIALRGACKAAIDKLKQRVVWVEPSTDLVCCTNREVQEAREILEAVL